MSVAQKHAWFNLFVVGFAAVVVLSLASIRGWPGAFGGFGFMGFAGFAPLLYRKSRQAVLWDERDGEIRRRSVLAGFSVFWVVLVVACLSIPFVYGTSGSVPVTVIQVGVFVGMALFLGVTSLVTLAYYPIDRGARAA